MTDPHTNERSPEPGGPERGYVICSEHRSGSTLLCQWLKSTGVLGHPREYFAITENAIAIERDPSILRGVLNEATTANGIYGIKLFSQQFDNTMKAGWLQRLPNPRFIHLERRDLLGQAISLVRAMQTQAYQSDQEARSAARYDGKAIRRQLTRLTEANGRWRLYFARNGIEVLWLVYEDMIRDPDAAMRAVASHVRLGAATTEPPTIDARLIKLAVQRDSVSAAWRTRFLAEAGDTRYLDHPLGRPRIRVRRLARDVGQLVRRLGRLVGRGEGGGG